jgi:hypothetical protein
MSPSPRPWRCGFWNLQISDFGFGVKGVMLPTPWRRPMSQSPRPWRCGNRKLAIFSKCDFGGSGCHVASTLLRSSGALAEACWLQRCTLLHVPLECTCGTNTHLFAGGCYGAGWAERRRFLQQPQNPAKRETFVHPVPQADEVFTSGTAVVVCSVGSITYKGQRRQYGEEGQPGASALTSCPLPCQTLQPFTSHLWRGALDSLCVHCAAMCVTV